MTQTLQINQIIKQKENGIPLRELLQQRWLIPKRIVHFLRIREAVTINGKYVPMNTRVHTDEQVRLNFTADEFRTAESRYLSDDSLEITILYENDQLVIVNKPAGIKSHPNLLGEKGTLLNFVAAQLVQQNVQPFMVHRIDQQTSGAVIIAKNPVVVPILDRLIATKKINREYVAIVRGQLPDTTGTIELPIGRDPDDQRKRMVDNLNGQPAITHYRVLNKSAAYSLVALQLETGRTHQLRVHLSSLGCPILNDPLYSDASDGPMMLHGDKINLVIPFAMDTVSVGAPLPFYFQQSIIHCDLK